MAASACEQLSFDIEEPASGPSAENVPEVDLVEAVLASHNGDYRKAISELLADADFLRNQLYAASQMISSGYVRGTFRPKYERP